MITLYKGDDTAGQLGKKCFIKFHCDDAVDMSGVTVKLNLLNIVTKEFTEVVDGSILEVFISHTDSRKLPLGITYGRLWGEDSSGKIRTFANRIPFCVTTDLRKVYGSDGFDSQDIHVYSSADWDAIANKPTLFPSKVEMVEGLEEALKQAGRVKTVNGQEPDADGNISIDVPTAKVTSVNGKEGAVELSAQDIPYGGEGASNVETAIELNTQAVVDNAEAIDSLEEQLGELKEDTYNKQEVDDKISRSEAHYITADAAGSAFATEAALKNATKYYYAGEEHSPDKNDYAVVLNDGGKTSRWAYFGEVESGEWQRQYFINETSFTQAQWAAINSLISRDEDGNLIFNGHTIATPDGVAMPKFTGSDIPTSSTDKTTLDVSISTAGQAAIYAEQMAMFARLTILDVQFVQNKSDLKVMIGQVEGYCYVFSEKKLWRWQFTRGYGVEWMYIVPESEYPAVVKLFTHNNSILDASILSNIKPIEDGLDIVLGA